MSNVLNNDGAAIHAKNIKTIRNSYAGSNTTIFFNIERSSPVSFFVVLTSRYALIAKKNATPTPPDTIGMSILTLLLLYSLR